jgi:hypothetical protein
MFIKLVWKQKPRRHYCSGKASECPHRQKKVTAEIHHPILKQNPARLKEKKLEEMIRVLAVVERNISAVAALEIPSLFPNKNFVFACGLARNYKKCCEK